MPERAEALAGFRPRLPIRRRLVWSLTGFGALAVVACLLAPLVGSTRISLAAVFDRSIPYADNIDAQIFFVARLPRVVAAALAGSALALSGVVFQALLRNPLASPDTLGVSAGASLGAMMAITFGLDLSLFGISAVPLASFSGSIGALAIVYGLSAARRRGTSAVVLLLGGVTLQALLSAVIGFVQYRGFHRNVSQRALADGIAGRRVLFARRRRPCAHGGRVGRIRHPPRVLDLISVGSESAAARSERRTDGARRARQRLARHRRRGVPGGPVSFIGIIVPHLVRLIVGADHRLVLPASALFGGAFLIGCDLVARTILAPLELPVGIVTAIIGGPVFLWLLFRRA